jgi:predicted  nucleic acid-binding Zn ribbon protein
MKVFDIVLDLSKSGYADSDIEDKLWTLLCALTRTGQIINDNYIFIHKGDRMRVSVVCPEPDSLSIDQPIDYVSQAWQKLAAATGAEVRYEEIGVEPQFANYQVPQHSSFYILRYGAFSPVVCGDTFKPIPLYKIPPTHPDGKCYDNLRSWERNYRQIYGLWINGEICEDFFQQQMQDPTSELSAIGRNLCQIIERLTGQPTYYFLLNYRDWSVAEDLARLCPLTGREWLLAGKSADDAIAFKCDESRLVSELSHNCSDG